MNRQKIVLICIGLIAFLSAGLYAPEIAAEQDTVLKNATPFEQYSFALILMEREEYARSIEILQMASENYLNMYEKRDRFYDEIQNLLAKAIDISR